MACSCSTTMAIGPDTEDTTQRPRSIERGLSMRLTSCQLLLQQSVQFALKAWHAEPLGLLA